MAELTGSFKLLYSRDDNLWHIHYPPSAAMPVADITNQPSVPCGQAKIQPQELSQHKAFSSDS